MNIIIHHGNIKRKISGPFNICGSKEDLIDLKNQIERKLLEDFDYGWIDIVEYVKCESKANTAPVEWE